MVPAVSAPETLLTGSIVQKGKDKRLQELEENAKMPSTVPNLFLWLTFLPTAKVASSKEDYQACS